MLSHRLPAAIGCLLIALLVIPSQVHATIGGHPVKVTLESPPVPTKAGQSFEGVLRIRTARGVAIDDITLTGAQWSVERFDLPRDALGASGASGAQGDQGLDIAVPFRATPGNPDAALIVEWTRDGEREFRVLDVSPEAFAKSLPRQGLAHPPGETPVFHQTERPAVVPDGFREAWRRVRNSPEDLNPDFEKERPEVASPAHTLTVTGRVIARHNMTEVVGASWCQVTVISSDPTGQTGSWPFPGTTDVDGYFSVDITWTWPAERDIQIRWVANSPGVVLLQYDDAYESSWDFLTPVFESIPEGTLDVGVLEPATVNGHGAQYIAATIARAHEFNRVATGWLAPNVEVLWPDSDGSAYSWFNEIHIAPDDRWNEETILHEYGHHFNESGFGYYHDHAFENGYYCNGVCDDEIDWWFDDCGHCIWCEESDRVAWNEGLAYFFSRYWSNGMSNYYADLPAGAYDHAPVDDLQSDDDCPTPQDANITEGFFAAVLWDLVDGTESDHDDPEHDATGAQPWEDVMSGWDDEVLDVINVLTCADLGRRPRYPSEFGRCFLAQYPNFRNDIWETFAHNGYDVDEEPPPYPTSFQTSPAVNVSSPDNTVTVDWDRPYDDASGIEGYRVLWANTPTDPGIIQTNRGDVTREISSPLAPGTWYLTIRSRDRSGRWSAFYSVVGPFLILEPDPVDLEPAVPSGWDYALVPRNDQAATQADVHLPSALNGGQNNTYWNFAMVNSGDQASIASMVGLYLDSETNIVGAVATGSLGGGVGTNKRNEGPVVVPGGRHTLGMFVDASEVNAESDEFDNYWATGFVWYPPLLNVLTTMTEPSPPPINGGFAYYEPSNPFFPPCRGYNLEEKPGFTAVTMFADDDAVDYDLALFDDTYGVETGFETPLALSARVPNTLEAVFVNLPVAPYDNYFIGVRNETYNWGLANADFQIRGIRSQSIGNTYGTYTGGLSSTQLLDLYDFHVDPATGGSLTITLIAESSVGKLYMGYFDPSVGIASIVEANPIVMAAGGDSATISVPGPFSETAAVAVWREPWDGMLAQVRHYTLRFEASPPDPAPYASSKWVFPIVPQTALFLPPYTIMSAPTQLVGGGATYLYVSEKNYSPATAPLHDVVSLLDGVPADTSNSALELPGYDIHQFATITPHHVAGGRHTLGVDLDRSQSLHEINENNNAAARQWVWRPPTLSWNTHAGITDIVNPTGGWEDIPATESAFYNCLGFRMQSVDPHVAPFTVAFLANAPFRDGDLRIHEVSTGVEDGFERLEKASGMSLGQSDFIIMRTGDFGGSQLDLGVVGMEGTGTMYLEADGCGSEVLTATGRYEWYTLSPADFVQLHRVQLPRANYHFRVVPTSGDIAISFHKMDVTYSSRLDALEESNEGISGEEEFWERIPTSDTYILAVWRPKTRDYLDPIDYQIFIERPSVGIGDDPPVTLGLTLAAAPNPFGSSTVFHVKTVEDAPLRVAIHDMRGAVVRRIEGGLLPPGSHRVTWDGTDDQGRSIARGVYFARVQSGERSRMVKVIRTE